MGSLQWAVKAFESAVELFVKDIEALEESQLEGCNGSARKPIDFAYEVGILNQHIARRVLSEPSSLPNEGWIVAPPEFRSKAAVTALLRESAETLLAATRTLGEDGGDRTVPTSEGETPVFDLVYFAAMHTMYHDGQLNYVQAIAGDLAVHWG